MTYGSVHRPPAARSVVWAAAARLDSGPDSKDHVQRAENAARTSFRSVSRETPSDSAICAGVPELHVDAELRNSTIASSAPAGASAMARPSPRPSQLKTERDMGEQRRLQVMHRLGPAAVELERSCRYKDGDQHDEHSASRPKSMS
jgi:hypothetical protein